jgi:hypothetical protein
MAITIDIGSSNLVQSENLSLINQHIDFIASIWGHDIVSKTILDEQDANYWLNIYFYLPSVSKRSISQWDELENYAIENEVYIYVYEHDSKELNAFLFDEDEVWLEMEAKSGKVYEKYITDI